MIPTLSPLGSLTSLRPAPVLAALVAAVLLTACEPRKSCKTDSDCGRSLVCDADTGLCVTPSSSPGCTPAAEVCNGLDDDCDGQIDEGVGQTWYVDHDGDGYGSAAPGAQTVVACSQPAGFAATATDCDDSAAGFLVNPGAQEICDPNGVDENCNGTVNEGCGCSPVGMTQQCCAGRGTQTCEEQAGGAVLSACSALASREVCNGLDDDCNGRVDDAFAVASPVQLDGGSVEVDGGCSVGLGACRRSGAATCVGGALACGASPGQPGAEVCNGLDDDCDGQIDEASPTLCPAAGQSCSAGACACPAGQEVCGGRCQAAGASCSVGVGACARTGVTACDGSGSVACNATPGAPSAEVCDGVDNNCDGQTDEGVTITCYPDEDGDGYATSATPSQHCGDASRAAFGGCPAGFVAPSASLGADCDPANASRFRVLSTRADADGDAYCVGAAAAECVGAAPAPGRRAASSCAATDDCNDASAAAYRSLTVRTDADGDGYCVGLPVAQCTGAAPLPGTILATSCLGDDCKDTNNQATTACYLTGAYTTAYHTKLCGIGPAPTEDAWVSTTSYCPFGFFLFTYRAEKSPTSLSGSCTALTQNTLRQTCNFLDGSDCRIVGDCVAN